eukprot:TRINITY_DN8810_c0_g1_i1.p1 TRINITY_DN8810_c0_g1~~TRINITY_DN8810_c0_g1_i1.p1  ORF type:complete len:156 (-),score=29.08 TRINITY_DN8810_c0_g1_i1:256-675(-)
MFAPSRIHGRVVLFKSNAFNRFFRIDVQDNNWNKTVVEASHVQPIIVDFTAKWCSHCLTLAPTLARVCAREEVFLAKYDMDVSCEQSESLNVTMLPTVYAFSHGRATGKFIGNKTEEEILEFVQKAKTDHDMAGKKTKE